MRLEGMMMMRLLLLRWWRRWWRRRMALGRGDLRWAGGDEEKGTEGVAARFLNGKGDWPARFIGLYYYQRDPMMRTGPAKKKKQ
jgi:hypothetical protein